MKTVRNLIFLLGAALLALPAVAALPSNKPNIIFILADDLGAEALGCYGGSKFTTQKGELLGAVKTPNLDALAQAGMRFEHCFATPVCSPSRAQLLTGLYNFRTGFIDILGRKGAVRSLDEKAFPTLAMRLQAAGYVTAAVGKWHIGDAGGIYAVPESSDKDTDYAHVRACGFDRQCMFGGFHLEDYGKPFKGLYTPDILQTWALRFLDSRKGKAEPFFLYYASPIPHFPYLPTPLNPDGPGRGTDKVGKMHGNMTNFPYLVEYLDQQVGEIVAKLTATGLRDNTLVMFAGDNGTPNWLYTEMRDGRKIPWGKGKMTDTGSWVPMIASWPKTTPAGKTYDQLVDFSDIMPTCLELAGAQAPAGLDGVSFAPQLQGKPGKAREWVHSLYVDKYFVRDAKWKLRENGELYDVTGSPYIEKLVPVEQDTEESKAARRRLQVVLKELHPAGSSASQTPAPEEGSVAEKASNVWAFTPDPALPNVLILGDSISIGYTRDVRAQLKGKANVYRPVVGNRPDNCSGTTRGIQMIDRWLGERKWDVIHFNFGLHDLKHVAKPGADQGTNNPEDPLQASVEQYAQNLEAIVKKLQATKARLIFATTTPVAPGTTNPFRDPADPVRYNTAALKIMKAHGIRVNDLFAFCEPQLEKLQLPKNVHFRVEGSKALARQVADAIAKELNH